MKREIDADQAGFLVAAQQQAHDDSIAEQNQLQDIHDELVEIREGIDGLTMVSPPRAAEPQPSSTLQQPPTTQPARPRATDNVRIEVVVPAQRPGPAPATTAEAGSPTGSTAQPARPRDATGRFAGGDSTTTPRSLSEMGGRVVSAIRESADGEDRADPAVQAIQEVAQPLSRGFGMIFGGGEDRHQERWYRRFWREMTQKRREDQAAHRQSQRTLRGIERNSGAAKGGGGGILGLIGLLGPLFAPLLLLMTGIAAAVKGLSNLLGLGRMLSLLAGAISALKAILPRSLPGLPGSGRPARAGGGTAGRTAGAADRRSPPAPDAAGRQPAAGGKVGALGRFARRIPLLGALLTAGAAAGEASSILGSDASRREKSQGVGRVAGGAAGTVSGMFAGAKLGAAIGALGGPIGVAIGGVVGGAAGAFFGDQAGQIVGEKVGGWTAQLQEADIPGQIVEGWTWATSFFSSIWGEVRDGLLSKWNTLTDGMRAAWESATEKLGALWEGAKDMLKSTLGALDKANDWIKDKTGMDPKGAVAQAGASIMSAGAAAAEKVSSFASSVKSGVERAASAAADKVKQGADWAAEHTTVGRTVSRAIDYANGNRADKNWGKAKDDIVVAAEAANVDPGLLAKIARYESNFDANAMPIRRDGTKISSAHGYGQFLDGTWMDMLNKHGAKYGVQGAGKLTKEQAQQYRGDTKLQAAMLAEFTKENMQQGRKHGGKDDDANVYAFHNLGGGDAKRLLTGMNAGLSVRESLMQGVSSEKERRRVEAVIAGNKDLYGDGSRSAAEAYKIMGDRMRAGDTYAQDARATALARRGEAGAPAEQVASATPAAPAAVVPPGVVAAMAPSVASAAPVASPAPTATTTIRPPSVPAPAEAPRTEMPIASSGRQGSGPAAQDVPRDLPDRRIAHIVTGSYSGMS